MRKLYGWRMCKPNKHRRPWGLEEKLNNPQHDSDSFQAQMQSPETRAALIKLARLKGILSAEDGEDIASEAIRQGMRKQAEYDPSRSSVRTFMIRIGENVIRTYYRKRSAKRRKAESGVISLDTASSGEGDDRN